MKNKHDIQNEIDFLIKEYGPNRKEASYSMKIINAARKKIALLTKCVQYIETNPREEFIHKQLALSNKRLEIISRDFNQWFLNSPKGQAVGRVKAIKIFEKEMDKKGVVLQIKTLNYILS